MKESDQTKLIEAAILAPSADNSQPFQYEWSSANCLNLFIDPDLSGKATDCNFVLSDIALGAVIESITLTACSLGQEPKVELLPDKNHKYWVAKIQFSALGSIPTGTDIVLSQQITHRCTDRRFPFSGVISQPDIKELQLSINDDRCHLLCFSDSKQINNIIPTIYKAERTRFESEKLHQELFNTVAFHRNPVATGMNLNVLGIKKFESGGFKLMRNWSTMKWLNKLGASAQIAKKSVTVPISNSPGLLLLTTRATNRENLITAGRQLLRVWLKCTELGLSVQPYAAPGVLSIANPTLEEPLSQVINEVNTEMAAISGEFGKGLMFLRIGYTQGSPLKTNRREIHSFIKN